jgi:hypothetical protein
MMKRLPIFVAGLLLLLSSCKKEEVNLTDPVPQIINVEVLTPNVVEYQDSIVFLVEYRDGDGDLGENAPNTGHLFVEDNRIQITEQFRVRELAPQGANIPITGQLRVTLRSTGITDNSNVQTFTYTIYLRDRAGNVSNRYQTSEVTVSR